MATEFGIQLILLSNTQRHTCCEVLFLYSQILRHVNFHLCFTCTSTVPYAAVTRPLLYVKGWAAPDSKVLHQYQIQFSGMSGNVWPTSSKHIVRNITTKNILTVQTSKRDQAQQWTPLGVSVRRGHHVKERSPCTVLNQSVINNN